MEEVQLRKTMGGYKRADVAAYIESLTKKYEAQLLEVRESFLAARAEAEAAISENAKLFEKITQLEAERDSVSRAVISAQREADKILAEAKEKADALLLEKELELTKANASIARVYADIHTLRLSAAAALRKYESALSALDKEDAEEE